jgi:cell division protein FtsN
MTRDYRRGGIARAAPPRKQGKSCVWSFILGAMVGAFAVGVYWVQTAEPQPPAGLASEQAERSTQPPTQPINWQFEDLLSDTEVDVRAGPAPPPPAPRPQPPESALAEPQAAAPAVTPGSRAVVVQVASFKREADAERLRAELGLLGITSRVEVTTSKGVTYHRVRTGPYADQAALKRVVDLLKRNGKEAMQIPVN